MTHTLPDWLALWLGIESNAGSSSTLWQLRSAWDWAPWVTVLFVLLAVGWVAYFYARETSEASRGYRSLLAVLRVGVIAVLLFMLAEWMLTVNRTGPPGIVLIIDRSASMQIVDQSYDQELASQLRARLSASGLDDLTRINLGKLIATQNNAQLLRKLTGDYRLQVYFVAEGIERQSGSAEELAAAFRAIGDAGNGAQASRLGDAVQQALREQSGGPPAAIILLSDGINTAGSSLEDAAALARRRGVPIYAVGFGSEQPIRDVELADVLVDDVVFVDDLLSFQASIRSAGLAGEQVRVMLRCEGDSTVLASETITLGEDGSQDVRLTYRPSEPGDVTYVVEAEPRDDEIDRQNNESRHLVSVRDDQIRVLLAFGYPAYEFRYLKNLLDRDSSVDVSTYLQEADADYVAQDETAIPAFPVARQALLEYDVVILGDVDPRLLPRSSWQNLRELVQEKGGGLAMLAGPMYFPWLYRNISEVALLLPIDLDQMQIGTGYDGAEGFSPQPTPLGLRTASFQLGTSLEASQMIWRNLPPVYWLADAGAAKPAAQVLAVHPVRSGPDGRNLPVIALQYLGNGRVLYHAIDSTWRWRFRVGDAYFARYWVQTIRMLARSKLAGRSGAELVVDRREYRSGEAVEVRARFFDQRLAPSGDGVTVLVESPGQRRERVTLDRHPAAPEVFEASLTGLSPGTFQLLLVEPALEGDPPTAQFRVTSPPGELARIEMDRAALESAVTATRGKFYTIADADRLVDELPAGKPVPIESLPAVPLWNHPVVLLLLVALLVFEWLLRRRVGML